MATKKQTTSKNTLSDGSVTLTFKVSAKDVAKAYTEVVLEYASTAEIKGFRKGKAPMAMVEKS
ncbi:MAG: trigger factor family protein, partial [bacterium]